MLANRRGNAVQRVETTLVLSDARDFAYIEDWSETKKFEIRCDENHQSLLTP
jgi:hypothetical protein